MAAYHVFDSNARVATELARFVVAQSSEAIAARGRFIVAFSGWLTRTMMRSGSRQLDFIRNDDGFYQ